MMKKDWEIKKQNLEGRTPSTCEAGVSPLQTSSLPQHALKADWEIKKLGDVCDIINGKNQKAVEDKNGPYPIYGSGGIMGYASEYLCRENTTIIGRKGSINNPLYVEEKFWNVDTAFGFQSKENYIPKLLFYFCKSFDFSTHNKGTTIPSLVKSDLLEIPIPVPPLEEQKHIVKILDEKFAQLETIKTNAQTNLQNAKDLFQSQLAKAFSNTTWEKKRLGDSSELITKGSSPKWQGINYVTDDGILFVTSENVRENYIDLEKSKYLEKKFNDKQKRSILKKNDVLVNIVGASIGRAAIFDFDIVDANINQAVALIRSKNEIDVHFLSYFLNSDNAMNQYNNAKKDTARANLSLEDINNLRIPLPPLSEQKRIVEELDTLSEKVRQLQEIYTKQIASCDELKQAYLQKAFEGEL